MGMIHYVRSGSKLRILAGDTPTWISNNARAAYITQVCLSAPLWAKFADFKALHEQCIWATVMTGELHHLDHIVPLNHPLVCGLTVPWNIEVRTARHNMAKSNKWLPDDTQLELF